jgi:hypothetical protein
MHAGSQYDCVRVSPVLDDSTAVGAGGYVCRDGHRCEQVCARVQDERVCVCPGLDSGKRVEANVYV